jgi:RNA ligase (TIGR02306 family)
MEANINTYKGRKLASVQIVDDIKPHLNSDNLALATVLGWQVVIKKEEMKIGEKIVYFEIDSLLPAKNWSEFMKEKKYRVKTINLRKEISQGLILPLSIIGEGVNAEDYEVGYDLTEMLGVTKYEIDSDLPDVNTQKTEKPVENTFPTFLIEKTDEPRIQSCPNILQAFMCQPYWASLKYDGTSVTYALDPSNPEEFYICSRNNRREFNPKDDVYSQVAVKYKIHEKLLSLGDACYALQGEIYGPKIQKNPLAVKEVKLVIFNAKDLKENRYLDLEELEGLCKQLNLQMVDVIEKGDNFNYSINDLKRVCQGFYPNTKNHREGLVFRLQKNWHAEFKRNSFKIINDQFLLKKDA